MERNSAYRLGQRRDVITYRLVTCGTVEEKMYRRQVFKVNSTHTQLVKRCVLMPAPFRQCSTGYRAP